MAAGHKESPGGLGAGGLFVQVDHGSEHNREGDHQKRQQTKQCCVCEVEAGVVVHRRSVHTSRKCTTHTCAHTC